MLYILGLSNPIQLFIFTLARLSAHVRCSKLLQKSNTVRISVTVCHTQDGLRPKQSNTTIDLKPILLKNSFNETANMDKTQDSSHICSKKCFKAGFVQCKNLLNMNV